MIYIITLELFFISVVLAKRLKKFWLVPFVMIFLFDASYFLVFSLGRVSLVKISLFLLLILLFMGKDWWMGTLAIFKKYNSKLLFLPLSIIFVGILVRFVPYIGNDLYPFVIGPNLDSIHHSVRTLNFVVSDFDIYNTDKSMGIAMSGINDLGLYPGGYHLFIAWLSLLLKIDVIKLIFPVTNILCGMGIFGYYFFLKEKGVNKGVSLISVLLLGINSNFIYWLYFSEYPAITSVYLFPAAVVIFEEIFKIKSFSMKIICGLLLMGYASFHSYFILYFILFVFGFQQAISVVFLKNGLKSVLLTLIIILVTSVPLTRDFVGDFAYNHQSMRIEDSSKNPLSSRFWGNTYGLSLPNLFCSPYVLIMANKLNDLSSYIYLLVPVFTLIYFKRFFVASLILVLILGYLRFVGLESPYNRLCLFGSIIFIPVLVGFIFKNTKIPVFFRSILLSFYLVIVFFLSNETIQSFKGEYLSSFNGNDYEYYNYLRNELNEKDLKMLFEKGATGQNSNFFWLKNYFLYKAKVIDLIDGPIVKVDQYDVLVTTGTREISGYKKSGGYLNNFIYKKL